MESKLNLSQSESFSLRFPDDVELCITLVDRQNLLFEVHLKQSMQLYYDVLLTPTTISGVLLLIHQDIAGLYRYLQAYSKQVLQMIFKQGNIPSFLMIKEWVGKKEKRYHVALEVKHYPEIIKEAKCLEKLQQEVLKQSTQLQLNRTKWQRMTDEFKKYEDQTAQLRKQYQSALKDINQLKLEQEKRLRDREVREEQINRLKGQIEEMRAKISLKECTQDEDQDYGSTLKKKQFEMDQTQEDKQTSLLQQQIQNSQKVDQSLKDSKCKEAKSDDSIKLQNEHPSQNLMQSLKVNSSMNKNYNQHQFQDQCVLNSVTVMHSANQKSKLNEYVSICQQNSMKLKSQNECIPNSVLKDANQQTGQYWITILSSNQQEKQNQQFWNTIGTKVELQFDHCPHMSHFTISKVRSGRMLEKTKADDVTSFLYHSDAVKQKQHFMVTISEIKGQDFIFGVMSASIRLRESWQQGRDVVCLNGLMQQIMNEKSVRNVKIWLQRSDSIITAVDLQQNKIWFFLNRTLIGYEVLPKSMREGCYFFVGTATVGNKIILQ